MTPEQQAAVIQALSMIAEGLAIVAQGFEITATGAKALVAVLEEEHDEYTDADYPEPPAG